MVPTTTAVFLVQPFQAFWPENTPRGGPASDHQVIGRLQPLPVEPAGNGNGKTLLATVDDLGRYQLPGKPAQQVIGHPAAKLESHRQSCCELHEPMIEKR